MKICQDCKHFVNPTYRLPAYCKQKVKTIIDPVYGTETYAKETIFDDLVDCYENRAEISHIENKCGPEGKHYERDWVKEYAKC